MANKDRISQLRKAALALAVCLMTAGCTGASATTLVIYVTPAPTLTPQIIYVTPAPTPTPVATATPAPTATVTAAPSPTASPTRLVATPAPATACFGNATNVAFFADAASHQPFDVYCVTGLPSSWWVEGGVDLNGYGGLVSVGYTNASGGYILIREGGVCIAIPVACSTHVATIGPAFFGDLAGTLYLYDSTPSYEVLVNPDAPHAYEILGYGMSQDAFVAGAAGLLVKVRKP